MTTHEDEEAGAARDRRGEVAAIVECIEGMMPGMTLELADMGDYHHNHVAWISFDGVRVGFVGTMPWRPPLNQRARFWGAWLDHADQGDCDRLNAAMEAAGMRPVFHLDVIRTYLPSTTA